MLKFTNFLTEAKVGNKNVSRAVHLVTKILQRRLKTKLYQFGGKNGVVQNKNGVGYLYFARMATGTRAFRVNVKKGAISSITIWKKFKLGKKGDFTVTFDGLNIVNIVDKIAAIIKDPKAGSHVVYKELNEEVVLSEARRVSPANFVKAVAPFVSSGETIRSLSWNRVTELAILADVNIPGVIRTKGKVSGKGKTARFDITLSHLNEPEVKHDKPSASGVEPQYFVKVTRRDPETNKFQSIKNDQNALTMTRQIQQAISDPDVKKEMKDPNKLFGIMKSLTTLVAKGNRNSLIIYGGPGTGKTYVVTNTLKEMGLTKNKDWYHVKGKITTASLYQNLFIHKNNKLLVFDDTDSVWNDAEAANVLKAALDSYDERIVSWMSGRTLNVSGMTDEEREDTVESIWTKLRADPGDSKLKLPSEFVFNSRIIFISNLPHNKFDSAVLTRSAKIDMTLTPDQMFARMEGIIEHLGGSDVPKEQKIEVLEFLKKRYTHGEMDEPSMRTFVAALDLYRSGLPNWKELLDYV